MNDDGWQSAMIDLSVTLDAKTFRSKYPYLLLYFLGNG